MQAPVDPDSGMQFEGGLQFQSGEVRRNVNYVPLILTLIILAFIISRALNYVEAHKRNMAEIQRDAAQPAPSKVAWPKQESRWQEAGQFVGSPAREGEQQKVIREGYGPSLQIPDSVDELPISVTGDSRERPQATRIEDSSSPDE